MKRVHLSRANSGMPPHLFEMQSSRLSSVDTIKPYRTLVSEKSSRQTQRTNSLSVTYVGLPIALWSLQRRRLELQVEGLARESMTEASNVAARQVLYAST